MKKIQRKNKSIKSKVLFVLLLVQIPLILLIIIYNLYFVNFFNTKIAESNKNALKSYCDVLEDGLERLNSRMINFIAIDSNFKLLSTDKTYLDAHVHSLGILDTYKKLMDENNLLYGCYIVSNQYQLFREVYASSGENMETNGALRDYFKAYMAKNETIMDRSWKAIKTDGKAFLYMIKGYKDCYSVYIIDVNSIGFPQDTSDLNQSGEILLFSNAAVLNEDSLVTQGNIEFSGSDAYYFTGNPQKYLVIEKTVALSEIRAAYIMKYKGFFGSLSSLQKCVIFASFALILILAYVGYQLLKKVFFRPVDQLVITMNAIKDGQMERRADITYSEAEFLEVNNTFNTMIQQINDLKIDTYEKELSLRQTQLDYFQIQIRPHFYVNCLKSIYGLLEEKRLEDTKKSIIYLSKHLRYMLKGASMIVNLEEELQYVQNYIELQQISMAYPPECHIELGEGLHLRQIPAISILSFVENSVKYGTVQNSDLKIGIYISQMNTEEENYLNIQISDNGSGFSDEQIEFLNNYQEPEKTGMSIGIYNVIQRFILYFGRDNVLFAFSNLNGAHVDIFIKEKD